MSCTQGEFTQLRQNYINKQFSITVVWYRKFTNMKYRDKLALSPPPFHLKKAELPSQLSVDIQIKLQKITNNISQFRAAYSRKDATYIYIMSTIKETA